MYSVEESIHRMKETMEDGKMTDIKCPSCGGKLEIDPNNSNMGICGQCNKPYAVQWIHSRSTGKDKLDLRFVPEKMDNQPVKKKGPKKSGWEPYGWKRGVALVILFFVLMGIMYGPKVYRRYQMDHGGIAIESQEQP